MLCKDRGPLWTLGLVLTILVFAISIISFIFVLVFRKMMIVAMGQPEMMAILCLGSMMIGSSMALYTVLYSGYFEESNAVDVLDSTDPEPLSNMDIMCNLALWFWYMGIVTIMTVLTCKLYRVNKVMRFRRNQKVLLRHVFGPFAVAQLVGIGILTTAQVLFPQGYGTFHGENGTLRFCCVLNNDFGLSLAFLYELMFGYLSLLSIGILLFAWKLRHVNEEIGHSRRLFWLCAFDIVVLVGGIIAIGIVHIPSLDYQMVDQHIIIYATLSVLFALNAIGCIAILIFPMIYYVWHQRKYGDLPENVKLVGTGRVTVNVTPKPETSAEGNTSFVPDGSGL